MLAELSRVQPGVPALAGDASQIPLGDASVDLVLAAQAWHWFDHATAIPEIARVLSSGGRLGLLWNVRDTRTDWVARADEILGASLEQDPRPVIGPPFGAPERHAVPWQNRIAPAGMIELAASRSAVILLAEPEREALLDRVRYLIATHPDLAGRETVELPYVTYCTRAELPALS
jgi:SAM-dependent methyltransferase